MTPVTCRFGVICAALLFAGTIPVAGAPSELLNRTITLTWVNTGTGTRPTGQVVNFQVAHSRTIYVSSAGRLFVRATRSVMGRGNATTRTREVGPGEIGTPARDMHFSGNTLVGTQAFPSGAAQYVVTFSGASSCSVSVVFGKSGSAPIRLRGPDDVMYEISDIRAASPSCSIRDGNAFAGQ